MEALISGGLPILTLLLGWGLAKWNEDRKSRLERRLEAYSAFIEIWAVAERPDFGAVMAKLLSGQPRTDGEEQVLTFVKERFDHAHSKLMVHGSPKVIRALSNFYSNTDETMSDEKKAALVGLLEAMRADADSGKHAEFAADVDNIMIGGPVERRQRIIQRNKAKELKE
ncbi:hypothetical protein [Alteriqipengyuania sp. 357]